MSLCAIAFLIDGSIREADIVQLNTSLRVTLGNIGLAGECARIGALPYLAGVVDPTVWRCLPNATGLLPGKKERASVVSVYPSYFGELVEAGAQLGYQPTTSGLSTRSAVRGQVGVDSEPVLKRFGK